MHQYESVSLVRLIANPDKYHNRKVRIIGVAHLEFETNGVYLTKEHCEERIHKNGLWIESDYEALKTTEDKLASYNGKYVLMEGVFDKNCTGHFGMWSGGLVKISRYDEWH